jgi:hypothetical protein
MADLTSDDVTGAFIKAGFTPDNITPALALIKSLQDVGITPDIFTPMLMRLKLIDNRMKVEQRIQVKKDEQQQQIGEIMGAISPEINSLNNELATINDQLAQLQS